MHGHAARNLQPLSISPVPADVKVGGTVVLDVITALTVELDAIALAAPHAYISRIADEADLLMISLITCIKFNFLRRQYMTYRANSVLWLTPPHCMGAGGR